MPRHITTRAYNMYSASSSLIAANNTPQSSLEFFNTLSDKLVDMVTSLKKQFEECNKGGGEKAQGAFLAHVDAPKMNIGVKWEYLEYIKRYGPPECGKFCDEKLDRIRIEFGIDGSECSSRTSY